MRPLLALLRLFVIQSHGNPQEVNWSHDFASVLGNVSRSMISVVGRECTLFLALADCYLFLMQKRLSFALRVGNSTYKGLKMSSLPKQEQLCQLIDEQQERIRQTFPAHRSSAVVALTRARDWHYLKLQYTLNAATKTATAHNSYLYSSGWYKALRL